MKRLLRLVDKQASWLSPLIFCSLLLLLIILYKGKFLILGGEGNFYLDYSSVKEFYWFGWNQLANGTGLPHALLQYATTNFILFDALQKMHVPYSIINIVGVFLNYCLPLVTFYLLLFKILKLNKHLSFIASVFYVINPLSTSHLSSLMFWNTSPLYVLPITFSIIYKYYHQPLQLFSYFGLMSLFLSFTFANIPYLGIFHIFIVMTLSTIEFLKDKINLRRALKNFLILESSFILFSAWWFLNLIRIHIQDLSLFYTREFATDWALNSSGIKLIFTKLLTLRTLLSDANINNDFLSSYYNHPLLSIVLLIPFFILLLPHVLNNVKKNNILLPILVLLSVTLFLNKGINEPFGSLYIFLLNKLPLFSIFKSPLEKFSVLYVFLLSLLIALTLDKTKNKLFYILLGMYLLISSVPYVTLNFIPDFKIANNKFVSRKFILKDEYKKIIELINNEEADFRVLSLPGSLNYQITMSNYDNRYYRGIDPILYSLNKPFITAYSSEKAKVIFDNLADAEICNLLALYNVEKILINKDIVPAFGFQEKQSLKEIDSRFSQKMKNKWTKGSITLFDNCASLNHFYAPSNVILVANDKVDLVDVISNPAYKTNSAIFFKRDNINKMNLLNDLQNRRYENVNLTHKKFNSVKYQVFAKDVRSSFNLTFLETFHKDWRAYIVDTKGKKHLISENEHLLANGYANNWFIDANKYCREKDICRKNSNSAYDLLIQVEFYPQRIINIGILLTGLTLLSIFLISIRNKAYKIV